MIHHSPPRASTKRNHCPVCNQPYTDTDMVECTQCYKWIHYVCANVDDDVINDPTWICSECDVEDQKRTAEKVLNEIKQAQEATQEATQGATALVQKANSVSSKSSVCLLYTSDAADE